MRILATLLFSLSIFLSPISASAAGLTSAQVQAILSLLSSFGADSSVIANVSLALTGSPTTPTPTSSSCSFTRDLTVGSSGTDVSCLQKTLSDKGYTLAFGVTGFFGVQTQAAVIAWQQAVGIFPASGYFGTISRSALSGTATTPTPSLKLSSLSPVSGPIGTTVTISGSGFTSSNNTLYVNNILAGAQISSSGSSLTFVIPAQLQGTCASYERLCLINNTVSSGSQAISIRNANGTSNSLTFTVVPPLLSSPVVCAADVSVCPDGSIVGRTGSACTFACGGTTVSNPDPGRWTGTWFPTTWPNGLSNQDRMLRVVDQSGSLGAGTVSHIPGCANQLDYIASTCRDAAVSWQPGQVVAVRYRSDAVGNGGYVKIYSNDGSSVGVSVSISLSTLPGDFSGPTACQSTSVTTPQVNFGTIDGKTYCPIAPNTNYYLNIRTNQFCSHQQCNFKVSESSKLQ